ncbi:hypothetical protein NL676_015870 [Syzygium grande]|nr:hypothetical protein NL676_015870 [Syzygium grande]
MAKVEVKHIGLSSTIQYEEENKELCQSETHGGLDQNKFHIVRNVEIHTIKIHDPSI